MVVRLHCVVVHSMVGGLCGGYGVVVHGGVGALCGSYPVTNLLTCSSMRRSRSLGTGHQQPRPQALFAKLKGGMAEKEGARGMMVRKHCNPTTPCEPRTIKKLIKRCVTL